MTDDDIDGLAAEYVLGSLDPVARKEVEVRRKTDLALDDAISAWEERLAPLNDLHPGIAPSQDVFLAVKKHLRTRRQGHVDARMPPPGRWLTLSAGACALAACLAIVAVWPSSNSSASPAKLVAELQRSATLAEGMQPTAPLGFVVSFDLRASTMIVSPLAVPPGSKRDYQLWLIPRATAPPISLGVISLAEPTTSPWLATYPPYDLVDATLAVSLEPTGGSPRGVPTGPTMFVGTLVQTMP